MNTIQHLLYDGSPFARPCDGSRNVQTSPVPFVPGSGDLVLRLISAATFRQASVAAIAQGAAAWRFVIAQNLDRSKPLLYATDAVTTASGGAGPDIVIDVSTAWTDAMRDAIGDRAKAVFLAELTGYASAEDAGTAASPVFSLTFPVCAANRRDDGAETSPARDLALEAHNADPNAHRALLANAVAKDATLFAGLSELSPADSHGAVKTLLNTILLKLKTMMTLLLISLVCASCAPAIAQTPLNDMPGTNTLYTASETDARIPPHVRTAPVEIPADAAARGVTFTDSDGTDQNAAVAIGRDALAGVQENAVAAAPSNTVIRSGAVAIGTGAVATNAFEGGPYRQQATAIGWNAHATAINATAIGSGAIHTNETPLTGGAPLASGQKAIAIGYGAKATANDAAQIGDGVNGEDATLKFLDTTIVRNGKIAVDETHIVSNAVETVMGRGVAVLDQPPADTNGYASVSLSSYSAATDADSQLIVAVNTNDAATAATIQIGTGPHVDIYKAATVDRLIAEAIAEYARTNSGSAIPDGVATTNDIAAMHPEFQEWASPTVDRIAASAVAPSTTTAQRGDTYVTTGAASGYALRAVRSVRSSAGMDSETEIPGTWSIVGNTTAANLSSNVLSSTSTPGDVTVEFAPEALGAATMRAVVSMPGDAVRTSTVWPSGENSASWRYESMYSPVIYDGAFTVSTNTWNGRVYICTNWTSASAQELVPAWYAKPGINRGGGLVGLAPHYAMSSTHCGEFGPKTWATGVSSGRGVSIATFGDLRLLRMTAAVPTNCVARFLRASILKTLSDSQLFRYLGAAHSQHGMVATCLVEPRNYNRADLSGLDWDSGWTYIGLDKEWRNADLADLRQYSHAAHNGDSGHPVWFWLANGGNPVTVPVGLFHWADGAGECLLSDALLDKIDAAIKRDSGGVESLSFYTAEELQ